MSWTVDTSTQDTYGVADPHQVEHVCAASAKLLVVNIFVNGATARTGNGPTYGGQAMLDSGLGFIYHTECGVETWYLINPPTGANNIVVQNDNTLNIQISATSYIPSSGACAKSTQNSSTGLTQNPSLVLTSVPANNLICGALGSGDRDAPTAGTNYTIIHTYDAGNQTWGTEYWLDSGTAGNETVAFATARADDWGLIGISFKELIPASSNSDAYTRGRDTALGNTDAYLEGSVNDLSNTDAYLKGSALTTGSQPAFAEGNVSETPISDSTLAFLKGSIDESTNQPAFLSGQDNTLTEQQAYLNGLLDTLDSQTVYMTGNASDLSSQPGYTSGQDTSNTSTPAYLSGSSNTLEAQTAYSAGQEDTSANLPSYLEGSTDTSTSTSGYSIGAGNILTEQNAYLSGLSDTLANSSSYLEGSALITSAQTAFLQGLQDTTDAIPVFLVGSLDSTSSLPGYAAGLDTLSDATPAYANGTTVNASYQSAYLDGQSLFALRPDGDVTIGGFENELGGTPLYTSIDEASPRDSDYVLHQNPTIGSYFEVSLDDPTGDIPASDHTIRWRAKRAGGTLTTTVKCELRQGGDIIASDEQTLTDSYQTFEKPLSGSEIASITNYNDLRLRFTVTDLS